MARKRTAPAARRVAKTATLRKKPDGPGRVWLLEIKEGDKPVDAAYFATREEAEAWDEASYRLL